MREFLIIVNGVTYNLVNIFIVSYNIWKIFERCQTLLSMNIFKSISISLYISHWNIRKLLMKGQSMYMGGMVVVVPQPCPWISHHRIRPDGVGRGGQAALQTGFHPPVPYWLDGRLPDQLTPDKQTFRVERADSRWFILQNHRCFRALYTQCLLLLLLDDPEVTANLYCNFAILYWEGCVICSIYLR